LASLLDALAREQGAQLLGETAFGVKPVSLGCYRELNLASRQQSEQQDRLLMPLTALFVVDGEIVTHDREVDRETLARHRSRS
jgi:hypothetical protein